MANQDRSSFLPFLKEKYPDDRIRATFYNKTLLLSQFERMPAEMSGDEMVYFLHGARNFQVGPRAEGDPLPNAGRQTAKRVSFQPKYSYARFGITGPVLDASKRDGAPTPALHFEVVNNVKDARFEVSRQLYGTGSGKFCDITDNVTNTVIPVTHTRHLAIGQPIVIATRSDGVIITDGAQTITDKTATTITVGVSVTVTTDMAIYPTGGSPGAVADAWNDATYGLESIIDERNPSSLDPGVPNYGGVDRSVAAGAFYRGNRLRNSGVLRPLTEDLMFEAKDAATVQGGEIDLIICGLPLFRKYGKQLTPDRRFQGGVQKYAGGYASLDFCGIPLVADPLCPPNVMWFIEKSSWNLLVETDFRWIDDDGAMLARPTGNGAKHEFEGCMYWAGNLACRFPNHNVKLEDLEE